MVEPPRNRHGDILPWFTPDEAATEALRKVVMDRRWLQSLKFYVNFRLVINMSVGEVQRFHTIGIYMYFFHRHTGALEAFHNLVLKYNPKRMHFR